MEGRDQAVQYLTQLKRDLLAKKEKLLRPVQEIENQIAHVTATLDMTLNGASIPVSATDAGNDYPIRKIRGLTHTEALIQIARYYGGTLRPQEAKVLMIRAGVMKNTKNSTHMVHGAIARSDAFERTKRGEYRLKETKLRNSSHLNETPAPPVQ